MTGEIENKKTLKDAIDTLNQIATSPTTPKTIKKNVTELIDNLQTQKESMSVRAANAISILDDVTQDPNMPSYVRVSLWQAVSKLEGIRE